MRVMFLAAAIVASGGAASAGPHPQAESQALDLAEKAISLRSVHGPGNQTPQVAELYRDALVAGGFLPENVVITPVDAAPVATETIASLRGALRRGVEAATPSRGGKGGHPVVCRGSVLEPFRRDERPPPLRDVLGALGEKRARVETQDGLVLVDLDTPEDVVAWTGRAPAFGGRKQR